MSSYFCLKTDEKSWFGTNLRCQLPLHSAQTASTKPYMRARCTRGTQPPIDCRHGEIWGKTQSQESRALWQSITILSLLASPNRQRKVSAERAPDSLSGIFKFPKETNIVDFISEVSFDFGLELAEIAADQRLSIFRIIRIMWFISGTLSPMLMKTCTLGYVNPRISIMLLINLYE